MVYPKQALANDNNNDKAGNKSIFDRPELRGSLNRRSASPAEERIIRVDSRKKIASSFASASASVTSSASGQGSSVKDRLRKISVESLVRKPAAYRRGDSPRDGSAAAAKGKPSFAGFLLFFSYSETPAKPHLH